ncbi:MAG TPA: MgtC/SapB family protein [Nocardioidaceae bacterium]|nr:MgtC/SapB family protein [Nocardioidaceae bacterium]
MFAEPFGEGWTQVAELALAFALSSGIGLERELRQKSAGLRTHTLVGLGAALVMLVSKYGFTDVLGPNVGLDPSRVAAQVVSGIGFIGGGLIFVHRGAVSGLTTAAAVWLTAAVGMAAGAGLPLLAALTTAAYFLVVYGYTPLVRRLPGSKYAPSSLLLVYRDGEGVLRRALSECTARGFVVQQLSAGREREQQADTGPEREARTVSVSMRVQGGGAVASLAAALSEVPGMVRVEAQDVNITAE